MDKKYVNKIERYIPQHLPCPNPALRTIVVAPSYSGKSYFINEMLTDPKYGYCKVFKPSQIYIMSPTYETDTSYKDLKKYMKKHEDNVVDDFDQDFIKDIFETQKKNKLNKEAKPVLLLIDDLVTKIPTRKQTILTDLFFKGRHLFVSIILTSQMYKAIPKALRTNACSYIFFSNNMNSKEINEVADEMPDDYITSYVEDLRKPENYFQYDFIYVNMKMPKDKRYYKNMNEILYIKD